MDRRNFVGGVAAMLSGPAMAGVGSEWLGGKALAGGKGYAPGRFGQIHYRVLGEGAGAAFLLVHQTPIGLAQYVDIQPALARAGRRAVASDNPGYGSSDPAPDGVTVADLADNLRQLCEHLQLGRVIVAGHHTGAAIAAAFAARHPGLVAGAVLHGVPLYDAEERAQRLSRSPPPLTLQPDGSHFSNTFAGIGRFAGIDEQSLSSITWATLGSVLAGPSTPVYRAVFGHDLGPDLMAIRAPTLVLSDSADSLHANDQRAVQLRPDFEYRVFSPGGSFSMMREPLRWAQELLDFAARRGL
jgi:pimeloyl-ACP methyl ester carboxylesterase